MVGAMAENACLFLTFNNAKEVIQRTFYSSHTGDLPITALLLAGAISGACTSFVLTPIELVKCKLQVQMVEHFDNAKPVKKACAAVSDVSSRQIHTFMGHPEIAKQLPGPFELVRTVVRDNGIFGLWRGQLGTFFRESGGSAAWFGAYESVTRYFKRRRQAETSTYVEMIIAGACAGMSYNFVLFPADTVKSRMQVQHGNQGFWETSRQLWRSGGIYPFYRGCGITVARAAPSSAAIFLIYESIKQHLA